MSDTDDNTAQRRRPTPHAVHLVVLTGMSGGGKTVALRALEDLEFYCVDNLPASLLPQLVNAVAGGPRRPTHAHRRGHGRAQPRARHRA